VVELADVVVDAWNVGLDVVPDAPRGHHKRLADGGGHGEGAAVGALGADEEAQRGLAAGEEGLAALGDLRSNVDGGGGGARQMRCWGGRRRLVVGQLSLKQSGNGVEANIHLIKAQPPTTMSGSGRVARDSGTTTRPSASLPAPPVGTSRGAVFLLTSRLTESMTASSVGLRSVG
jgi:hypothetical protein